MSEQVFNRVRIEAENLRSFVYSVLVAAGVAEEVAEPTATGLWKTSLRGVDSHGVRLRPQYVAGVKGGRLNPRPHMDFEQTGRAGGKLDADHTFGHAAGVRAMKESIALADQAGAGFVSVRNSSHCGALAYFAELASEGDMIGIAFTNATPKMRTPGSIRPFFGINPLCFTAPMEGEGPFCFDSAPTPFPNNKIKQYAEDGRELPPGVAADSNGRETLDPLAAAMLLPIGDYKGFGLAAVAEVFCGFLSGMPAGNKVTTMYGNSMASKRYLAQFYGAIRVDLFEDPGVFRRRLRELAEELRCEPARDGVPPPQLPGDPEKRAIVERGENGIPVTVGDWERFTVLSGELGVSLPPVVSAPEHL